MLPRQTKSWNPIIAVTPLQHAGNGARSFFPQGSISMRWTNAAATEWPKYGCGRRMNKIRLLKTPAGGSPSPCRRTSWSALRPALGMSAWRARWGRQCPRGPLLFLIERANLKLLPAPLLCCRRLRGDLKQGPVERNPVSAFQHEA